MLARALALLLISLALVGGCGEDRRPSGGDGSGEGEEAEDTCGYWSTERECDVAEITCRFVERYRLCPGYHESRGYYVCDGLVLDEGAERLCIMRSQCEADYPGFPDACDPDFVWAPPRNLPPYLLPRCSD